MRDASQAKFAVRKWYTFSEETVTTENGGKADGVSLWKHAAAVVVKNPFAGTFGENLDAMISESAWLGEELGQRIVELAADSKIESYGKAAIVGVNGEYEHGNALVTTSFADPIREIIGGGKAWIPSTGKRGGLGSTIDVPLAHKDALYVRSHYDTFTVYFGDAPGPEEIVVVFAVASRGRLHARVGGLTTKEIQGRDGLR